MEIAQVAHFGIDYAGVMEAQLFITAEVLGMGGAVISTDVAPFGAEGELRRFVWYVVPPAKDDAGNVPF